MLKEMLLGKRMDPNVIPFVVWKMKDIFIQLTGVKQTITNAF